MEKFKPFDHVDFKIITFEVRRKELLDCDQPSQYKLAKLCREGNNIQLWELKPLGM